MARKLVTRFVILCLSALASAQISEAGPILASVSMSVSGSSCVFGGSGVPTPSNPLDVSCALGNFAGSSVVTYTGAHLAVRDVAGCDRCLGSGDRVCSTAA